MTSVVSICNLALSNIGKDNIQDLNEPTAEARACKQFYEHVRDTLLQGYPWKFAARSLSLGEVTNDKAMEWRYAYSRPTDCLKVRSIGPTRKDAINADGTSGALPHDVAGGRIYCDVSPAFLNYTRRITDPSVFNPLFVEALAWHLAVRLAMPLTRDPKLRADAFQLAMQTQGAAEMADANEVRESSDIESEFIQERG